MHILLVADGRSPTALRWIQGLLALQHKVTLVSTFPCPEVPGVEALHVFPVAFSGLAGSQVGTTIQSSQQPGRLRSAVRRSRSLFLAGRYWFGPYSVWTYRRAFRRLVQTIQPDLVHSLRIPYEGMLASYTPPGVPLAVSIWGNDLTLHANGSPWMRRPLMKRLPMASAVGAIAIRVRMMARISSAYWPCCGGACQPSPMRWPHIWPALLFPPLSGGLSVCCKRLVN